MSQKSSKNIIYNRFMNDSSIQEEKKNSESISFDFSDNLLLKRRDVLKLMGASLALAGIGISCRRPEQKILPYNNTPEGLIPGRPSYYATMQPRIEGSVSLVVESHEGRPTKIEGNKKHLLGRGKVDSYSQASILELYDPDRSKNIVLKDVKDSIKTSDLESFFSSIKKILNNLELTQGDGLGFIHSGIISPTFIRLQKICLEKFPGTKFYSNHPLYNSGLRQAVSDLYSENMVIRNDFSEANVILTLQADSLMKGTGNITNLQSFSKNRIVHNVADLQKMSRLYSVESNYTVTGAAADHRLPLSMSKSLSFLQSLAYVIYNDYPELWNKEIIDDNVVQQFELNKDIDRKFLEVLASDLVSNRGKSLIIIGDGLDKNIHYLGIILNEILNGRNKTFFVEKTRGNGIFHGGLKSFVQDVKNSRISTLFIIGANPAYNSPKVLDIKKHLSNIKNVVHHGLYYDESASCSKWHIPASHYLEQFQDGLDSSGNVLIGQPLIAPLYNTISENELFNFIVSNKIEKDIVILKETWINKFEFSTFLFKKFLHDGIIPKSFREVSKNSITVSKMISESIVSNFIHIEDVDNLEIIFTEDYSVGFGSSSNLSWLQELPDPITKISWGNACLISVTLARKLSVKSSMNNMVYEADMIRLSLGNKQIEIPAFIMPGLPDYSVVVHYGYGRTHSGYIGNNVGVNVNVLSPQVGNCFAVEGLASKIGKIKKIATTQEQFAMNGEAIGNIEELLMSRNPARVSTVARYANDNFYVKHSALGANLKAKSKISGKLVPMQMTKDWNYNSGNQWAKVIDLTLCVGCNACTIACQAENNIPVVGEVEVMRGRIMHWIRIDRYFTGKINNPDTAVQPIGCMHCENAPCEAVCPVAATVHDQEGLNGMTYNRCIGTRYCANNCPYKARRFNYLDFSHSGNLYVDSKSKERRETLMMQKNPDVTVRYRGVMEKCSYCIQRINNAKIKAKQENRDPRSLEVEDVVVACQQTCPTNAIHFGSLTNVKSKINFLKKVDRNYELLDALNVRPRTSYLSKLRNRNQMLAKA